MNHRQRKNQIEKKKQLEGERMWGTWRKQAHNTVRALKECYPALNRKGGQFKKYGGRPAIIPD